MAEKAQQQGKTNETALDAELVDKTPKVTSNKNWFIWLLIVILLLFSASLYWSIKQQQTAITALQKQLVQTQKLTAKNTQLETLLKQQSEQTSILFNKVESRQQALTHDIVRLAENQQLSNAEIEQQWAWAEINSLLNTANQRLLLAGDVDAAIIALGLADKRVEMLDDFRLHPLRILLAEEKMALEAMADIDLEGMVLKLQSAINQVDKLQIVAGPSLAGLEQEQETVEPESWQQAWSGIWQQIRSLVVIRHKQDGSSAVLVPEERYFLYQNLRLQLETARFALMRGEVSLFKDSVSSASDWLIDYFVGDERDAMLAVLSALNQTSLNTQLPDISGSSSWLQQQGLSE